MKRTILLGQIILEFHFQVKRGAPYQAFKLFSTSNLRKVIWSWKKNPPAISTQESLLWIFKEKKKFLRNETKNNKCTVPQKLRVFKH